MSKAGTDRYDEYALKSLVERVNEEIFHAHRGVFILPHDVRILSHNVPDTVYLIAFGNDGYTQDDRTKRLVALFRERLIAAGYTPGPLVLNAGEDDEGYTWLIPVPIQVTKGIDGYVKLNTEDLQAETIIESLLWECWTMAWAASSPDSVQRAVARGMRLEF